MKQVIPTKVITGKVRLSYVHLTKPYANQPNQDPKFSTTLLIPKSDIATKRNIDAAIQAAAQQGVSDKWNGVRPPMIAIPIHDGDGARPSDGMPFGDECKGHWVMTASSKSRPEVVDLGLQPIMSESEIYSGMYARVSLNFFPYAVQGKKGIGCGLNNVQKLEDGEPLGGRTSAANDFNDLPWPGEQQYQQPTSQYQPPQPQQPAYQPQQQYQAPQQPAYQQPQYQQPQGYPQQQPIDPKPQQPAYQPQQQYQAPQQPAYQQPQYQQPQGYPQQQPIDPITGKPMTGQVMGI